ncbi:hypothetical protein CYLTODRAFT_447561 [Cylindrobasidium torrendii FP15055 ss-10]|uniref:Uncharacterized protein n=1 Tax=Cylindrobasidium torrendii FP15055 ss-10 TaxID=1314674 RepID=A0A0D7AV93_9AGAR|nr:hypothetical protein CYLTODRAFT_447561 [Cylindrobasidium torrendii FP15055 ss-10]
MLASSPTKKVATGGCGDSADEGDGMLVERQDDSELHRLYRASLLWSKEDVEQVFRTFPGWMQPALVDGDRKDGETVEDFARRQRVRLRERRVALLLQDNWLEAHPVVEKFFNTMESSGTFEKLVRGIPLWMSLPEAEVVVGGAVPDVEMAPSGARDGQASLCGGSGSRKVEGKEVLVRDGQVVQVEKVQGNTCTQSGRVGDVGCSQPAGPCEGCGGDVDVGSLTPCERTEVQSVLGDRRAVDEVLGELRSLGGLFVYMDGVRHKGLPETESFRAAREKLQDVFADKRVG